MIPGGVHSPVRALRGLDKTPVFMESASGSRDLAGVVGAIRRRRTEIVEALLENGADKDLANTAGRTALETVAGPFEDVKPIYDSIQKGLAPLGLRFDYGRIRETRPKIAEMLR